MLQFSGKMFFKRINQNFKKIIIIYDTHNPWCIAASGRLHTWCGLSNLQLGAVRTHVYLWRKVTWILCRSRSQMSGASIWSPSIISFQYSRLFKCICAHVRIIMLPADLINKYWKERPHITDHSQTNNLQAILKT